MKRIILFALVALLALSLFWTGCKEKAKTGGEPIIIGSILRLSVGRIGRNPGQTRH